MTELEERLSRSLRVAGEDAPPAVGLAAAARVRASRRRRRTALAATAGVVAVAVVVGGVALLGRGGTDGSTAAVDRPTPSGGVPATRVETWHDASVTVPADWGHGSLSTWCVDGSEPGTPVVERPGGVTEAIACSPSMGYGVRFAEGDVRMPATVGRSEGDDFPAGSWQGFVGWGGVSVEVVAPTRELAQQVIDSATRVQGVDGNGCAPRRTDALSLAGAGQVRLCRYDVDGRLEQSELLSGADARSALAALDAAPVQEMHSCPMSEDLTRIDVVSDRDWGTVQLSTTCPGFGWRDTWRELTADVLHWVLSPGWTGQVPDGVGTVDLRR